MIYLLNCPFRYTHIRRGDEHITPIVLSPLLSSPLCSNPLHVLTLLSTSVRFSHLLSTPVLFSCSPLLSCSPLHSTRLSSLNRSSLSLSLVLSSRRESSTGVFQRHLRRVTARQLHHDIIITHHHHHASSCIIMHIIIMVIK